MADDSQPIPKVPILLLGDAGTGKSTFLSRLMLGSSTLNGSEKNLPTPRDMDQPFCLDIRMYNRPYRFEFYDTASPTNYSLLHPEVIILCYSIADPDSLKSVHTRWKSIVETHFNYDEQLPVILVGLMRDHRRKEDYEGRVKPLDNGGDDEEDALVGRRVVYPQEALRIAQEMRLDKYCECSAVTGEVRAKRETFDIKTLLTFEPAVPRVFRGHCEDGCANNDAKGRQVIC